MALIKLLVNIIFSVVKSMAVLAFNVFALMSVSLCAMCRISRVNLSSLMRIFSRKDSSTYSFHRLLVKHGMENANPCKLHMNPGSDLDSLPILDTPDKLVVHAYAEIIGKLLYVAINTVPQLSYSMSCRTFYMSKTAPAHLIYAKVVLRCLIGMKGRKLTWCGKRVSLRHVLCEILA